MHNTVRSRHRLVSPKVIMADRGRVGHGYLYKYCLSSIAATVAETGVFEQRSSAKPIPDFDLSSFCVAIV